MRKYLLITRAGDESFHGQWLTGPAEREYDIWISHFGTHQSAGEPGQTGCEWQEHAEGPKWTEIARIVHDRSDWVAQYEYVWVPDDDVQISLQDTNRLFAAMKQWRVDLGQPALSFKGQCGHDCLRPRRGCVLHYTNFVEGMAPCFSRAAIELCRESFFGTKSGWGIDLKWAQILGGGNRIAVFDEIQMCHPRPFGGPLYEALKKVGVHSAWEELIAYGKEHNLSTVRKTLHEVRRV